VAFANRMPQSLQSTARTQSDPCIGNAQPGPQVPSGSAAAVTMEPVSASEPPDAGLAQLRRLRESLAMLRDATSTADLVQRAVGAACTRDTIARSKPRVQGGLWVARSVHVDGDPHWAAQILAAGRENPQRLAGRLPEVEVVRRGQPVVVPDVAQLSAVHVRIAEASGSRSYVAAPIVAEGEVVGLLHADRHFRGRRLGPADAEVLATFGEALGLAMARTAVLDRLADAGRGPQAAGPVEGLTPRELDVLRGMAAGQTNAAIAARLVVTEGTVKTHVQHILRKLGAANRAEAVTRWLASGPSA
jgi:DNA-binding CsgD family transcriptional regulator